MRPRLMIIGLVLICGVMLTGCGLKGVPVMAYGIDYGNAINTRNGYFVPLEAAARLVGAEISVDSMANTVIITYEDSLQMSLAEGLLIQRGTAYVLLESLPSILGVEGVLMDGTISLQVKLPELQFVVTVEGITVAASSALRPTGEWVSDDLFELVLPHRGAFGLSPAVLYLTNSSFTELRLEEREDSAIIRFTGEREYGFDPRVHFTSGRTDARIVWPERLRTPISAMEEGRRVLEVAIPKGQGVRLLTQPTLATAPIVRMRQRADLLVGPEATFPVLKGNIGVGAEGVMLAFTPGWVKVLLQGHEGWLPERAVALQLQTPNYPLSLRSSPITAGTRVGVISPNTIIILKEKVNGGYLVSVPSQSLEGYLLDEQLFFDSIMHLPPQGLARAIRFEVQGAIPPADMFESEGFFKIIDVVPYQGNAIVTVGVPALMNLNLSQSDGRAVISAGVLLERVVIAPVASGQQFEFVTDGAHELIVKRASGGLSISIPYAVASSQFVVPVSTGHISRIEVNQLPDALELSVTLDSPLAYRVFESRLLTVMSPGIAGKIIVIDPGHGGRDPGALGKLGWDEKDFTLDIAKRLARELEKLDAVPVLTHEGIALDKKFLTDERLLIVNQPQNDLFLSIHLNAFGMASVRGAETYYFNKEEDLRLAKILQPAMARVGMRDRGVINSRTFALLRKGQAPGVLLEVAYLSSPADERLLSDEKNRDLLAQALTKGIEAFFAKTR